MIIFSIILKEKENESNQITVFTEKSFIFGFLKTNPFAKFCDKFFTQTMIFSFMFFSNVYIFVLFEFTFFKRTFLIFLKINTFYNKILHVFFFLFKHWTDLMTN